MAKQTGQCLCGEIKYELSNPPAMSGVCHCKNCQRQAGSAFSTICAVAQADFKLSSGSPKVYQDADTATGNTVQRFFCANCGSPIYSALAGQPDMLYLKSGTLDDTADFAPQFHVWGDSKQNWVDIAEGVPTMAKGS